jgi:hypothetical protein
MSAKALSYHPNCAVQRGNENLKKKRLTRRRNRGTWKALPSWITPVDVEEFMFCISLFDSAYRGKMATPNPSSRVLFVENEKTGEVNEIRSTNIPINRAIGAVVEHFHGTRKINSDEERERMHNEYMATAWRITAFGEFFHDRLKVNDARIKKYVQFDNEMHVKAIEDSLIKAAATAEIGLDGQLKVESMFDIAERISTDTSDTSH